MKLTSIMDVSQKISSSVDESLSRAQKQIFLKQQLEAIQKASNAKTMPSTQLQRSRMVFTKVLDSETTNSPRKAVI